MKLRIFIACLLAMLACTANAAIWSYKWPDGSTSYHNNKPTTKGLKAANLKSHTDTQVETLAKASPLLITPRAELAKALLPGATAPVLTPPAPTRAEIEKLATAYGMTYPVPVTKAFIEAEATKLGMVYPTAAAQPDFTLLEKVFVNGGAPCTVLKADIVKPLGGNVYMAKVNLWDASKPLPPGACN
jgi:hypothetical protein